jgi:hypothetical protein
MAMSHAMAAITATPREEHVGVTLVFSFRNPARTRNVTLDYCTKSRYIRCVGCACASDGESEYSHGAH